MSQKEDLLTPEELSALVPELPVDEAVKERERKRRVVPYNFRRPDRLSKEQVRSLYLLHDLFAHSLSSSLPLFLRAASEVSLISVEQQSYGDYQKGLADPTTIFTVAANTLRSVFAVEMSSTIAFPVIDRMLGGEGHDLDEPRAATELELRVLEGFLAVIAENYRDAWKSLIEFEVEVIGRETRPQLLQIVAPNEIVVTIAYQVQIGDAKGLMSFCLPVAMLETVIKDFGKTSNASEDQAPPENTYALLKTISAVCFDVSAELEKVPIAVADLMDLAVGDVLRTHHSLEKPINICIADKVKFIGKLASADGKKVVSITKANQRMAARAAA